MSKLPNYDPREHMPRLDDLAMTRREMLRKTGMGMGALSLSMLLRNNAYGVDAVNQASALPRGRGTRDAAGGVYLAAVPEDAAAAVQGAACD